MILPTSAARVQLQSRGRQQVCVSFTGERIVTDTGLLAVRALEQPLGLFAQLADGFPDPRSQRYVHHSAEALLTQEVYQILAGYPDCNDAEHCRDDPLFQILAEVAPDPDNPLASRSTLARFSYAYTRRQAELPLEERPVLLEIDQAQTRRIKILNAHLLQLFIRTRRATPTELILDFDPTDDPVHGQQHLSAYHGYYQQHQYFPLLVYEGHSGFPLAAWLRPGTSCASRGAVEVLKELVTALRAAWPNVPISVRGDGGLTALCDFCEDNGLSYGFGLSSNAVLQRLTACAVADVELYYRCYGHRDPHVQRYDDVWHYQAENWPHARRVVVKLERTPQGSQRRFVVTNRPEPAAVVYREWYVRRGAVPEQPIGELKNGLQGERLSAHGFRANALRLLVHVWAYALVVLFREAVAAVVPEVSSWSVATLRQRLWRMPAVVRVSRGRVWFEVWSGWPQQALWQEVCVAIAGFVAAVQAVQAALASVTPLPVPLPGG